MDLKQLRYFLAVAEELNVSRAAGRLHISQPPLTRQIHALEAELGTRLFVRTSRGVELTNAGKVLLEEAPHVLQLASRASDNARRAGGGLTGYLDVATFGSAVLHVIPTLLAAFRRERPDVIIRLYDMTKIEQIDALRDRRISLGFNRLVPEEPDLVVETVLRERLLVALPAKHRLVQKRSITLADLASEPMVLYPNLPISGLAQEVVAAFRAAAVPLNIAQEVQDVVTCIALVASGFGLTITAESSLNLRLPGVEYRPLRSPFLRDIELACLYRKGDDSPVLQSFIAVIRRTAALQLRPTRESGQPARSVRQQRR